MRRRERGRKGCQTHLFDAIYTGRTNAYAQNGVYLGLGSVLLVTGIGAISDPNTALITLLFMPFTCAGFAFHGALAGAIRDIDETYTLGPGAWRIGPPVVDNPE